jgi:hypothetical protein
MMTSANNVEKKVSETELSVARADRKIESKLSRPIRSDDSGRNRRTSKAKQLELQIPGQDFLFDLEPYRVLG